MSLNITFIAKDLIKLVNINPIRFFSNTWTDDRREYNVPNMCKKIVLSVYKVTNN